MLLATTTTGIDNVHLKAEYLLMPRRVRHWQNSVMCLLGHHEHSMYLPTAHGVSSLLVSYESVMVIRGVNKKFSDRSYAL
jgi:hypothetical protein